MSPESIATESKREGKLIRLPVRGSERRKRQEMEFLPAALEIIETPASVVARVMMGVIFVLVCVAIGWACVGQIDIVETANGRIIPSGQVKVIQPLEIGVVKRIRVADGDHVTAGDVLIEIDPTTDAADRDRIARDLMQAELDIARLQVVLALDSATFVPPPSADPALADAERRQLVAQLAQHKAKIDGLDQQIAAKAAEREQAKAVIAKLDDSIPLFQGKADIYDKLRENQLTSQITRLDAERQLSEAKHDRLVIAHQVDGLQAQIAGLIQQHNEADAEFRRQNLDALGKATQYSAAQRQELIKAAQRIGLQELRAPVAGTVEQLSVHTIGGVVPPRGGKPVRHPGHASPTQEDDHGDPSASDVLNAATRTLEQGQAHRAEAAVAVKACLVDPYPIADGRTHARLGNVQSGNRQQAAGCDIVALRVEDVAPSGYAVDRATVRQKKTGRPVGFELTEQTRQAVDDYIKAAGKKPGEFLFSGRGDRNRCMTTRQCARLVSSWVATIGLDPSFIGRIHCAEPRRHSSTSAPAPCGPCNFCWGTRRLIARCAISGSRSMTLSPRCRARK